MRKWKFSSTITVMKDDEPVTFWENVVKELDYTGKERKALAEEAHFDASNIGKGVKNNNVPSVETAYRIARSLHVSVEYLMEGTESPKTKEDKEKSEELKKFRKYRKVVDDLDALDEKDRLILITMIAEFRKKKE
jgi:transcriptional regulator with XRE-family HTH domain